MSMKVELDQRWPRKHLCAGLGLRCMCAAGLLLLLLLLPAVSQAQVATPFSYFTGLTQTEKATAQIKLTYMGPQLAAVKTRLFHTEGEAPQMDLFLPFRHSLGTEVTYLNDTGGGITAAVSPETIQAIVDAVASLPAVTDGGSPADPDDSWLAFSIVVRLPTWRGFDSVLTRAETAELVDRLAPAFMGEKAALQLFREYRCLLDLAEATRAVDMTSAVKIELSGMRIDHATGHFVSVATVTNISTAALPAPISLVVLLPSTAHLVNFSGRTCRWSHRFLTIEDGLAPGASAEFRLEVENSDLDPITVSPSLLAGPGTR